MTHSLSALTSAAFVVFSGTIFSKALVKAQFSSWRTAAFRKLAGKDELGFIFLQELNKTFLTLIFILMRAVQFNWRQVPAIVSQGLSRHFTQLMQENCAKKTDHMILA